MLRHRHTSLLIGALLASAHGLHRLGDGTLAAPGAWSPDALARWYDAVGPALAVMVGVRLAALAAVTWLALAASLQLLVALHPGERLQRLADAAAPALLRRALRGVAGLSMSFGVMAPAAVPGTAMASEPAQEPVPGGEATATMRPLDPVAPPATPAPAPPATPAPAPAPAPEAAARPTGQDGYRVEVGQHLWAIATETVGEALGREPSEREVRRYWVELIAANRDRLVVPDNPDLLYPDQLLRLPAV